MTKRRYVFVLCLACAMSAAAADVRLQKIGTFETGIFGDSAAEIVAHDPTTQRLFVQNAADATVDAIDISDPAEPVFAFSIEFADSAFGKPTNVDVDRGVVAVTVENVDPQAPGFVVFLDTDGALLNQVTVGARPDMLAFSANGRWLLTANEGVPSDDYTIDPEGSVSVIDMRGGAHRLSQSSVRTADFSAFNDAILDSSIRIFGPGASVAQDLEPEHITISQDSRTAWVALQENNAIATIDIRRAKVSGLFGLGFQNHAQSGNALDASDKDDAINIRNWPISGMYQPDAIASYRFRGRTFLVLANEGDARDFDGFSEEARIEDLTLDANAFPNAAELQNEAALGRLKTTTVDGDLDGDGEVERLFSFGSRSFSIRDAASGAIVFDSGDDFERITAEQLPTEFNSNDDENDSFDKRSDDKGPEPEYTVVGTIAGRTYAFIGLERIGGIMVYDVSNPHTATFATYVNTRNFSGDPELGTAGDLSPEGLVFIPARESPNGKPLLAVAFEVSGTVGIFEIEVTR